MYFFFWKYITSLGLYYLCRFVKCAAPIIFFIDFYFTATINKMMSDFLMINTAAKIQFKTRTGLP